MKVKLISIALILSVAVLAAFLHMRMDIASPVKVQAWLDTGALIVDVRTKEEFASECYDGAVNVPLACIEKNINRFGKKNKKIIVYSSTGNKSRKAKQIFKKNGFMNVINGGGLRDMPR